MKTLKDIVKFNIRLENDKYIQKNNLCPEELRDAAKEWIKELEETHSLGNGLPDTVVESISFNKKELKGMIFWIKHFFNLEEE